MSAFNTSFPTQSAAGVVQGNQLPPPQAPQVIAPPEIDIDLRILEDIDYYEQDGRDEEYLGHFRMGKPLQLQRSRKLLQ
ncbi:unnamed protein product [Caenorhabditis nigoni]